MTLKIMEALYYNKLDDQVQCILCPHQCFIREGHAGICGVRRNVAGSLMADTYGKLSAIHVDPIEKKPLYHFFPGNNILSLGSVGCNMRCGCCQNWQISQVSGRDYSLESYSPDDILQLAAGKKQNIGVAYTYNEPGIWFEFMLDTARLIHQNGLKNVMVSNGFIAEQPLHELLQVVDAFNIDLKSFSDEFYRKQAGAKLEPVLRSLIQIHNAGQHLEITCLIIPTLNDNEKEFRDMAGWISHELGNETVLHLSRYHPMYRMNIEPTPQKSLEKLYSIAREYLKYVYVGNLQISDYQDTWCSQCGKKVISRRGYQVDFVSLSQQGMCRHCGNLIIKNMQKGTYLV
jgi:pyruvate formate lyase activating enzyme